MKLGSIQFLRAVAALLVAYAHSIDLQETFSYLSHKAHSLQQDFFHLEDFGAFGVDIFFVISGFIISYSAGTYKGSGDAVRFLVKRFKRIIPIYYLATLIVVLTFIPSLIKHSRIISSPDILKSIILLPVFDKEQFIPPILFPAWTLSFEWFFYLLFFLTIFLRTRYKEGVLLLLITALVITGFFNQHRAYQLVFMTNPILLEFLLGVCLYWCYARVEVPKKMAFVLLITGIGICLCEIINGYERIYNAYSTLDGSMSLKRFLLWGIPAGLLVAGCIFLEKAHSLSRIWNNSLTTLLGDASYSIYLVNYMIYGLCGALYNRVGFFLTPDLAILLQLLVAVMGGLIFYRLIEKPLLQLLHKRRQPVLAVNSTP